MKKKIILLLLMVATSFAVNAQTETLFNKNNSYGGFGGPIIQMSTIGDELVGDVGGGGALIVNDFFIGGYGMGVKDFSVVHEEKDYKLDFEHGGFWLGYARDQHKLLHFYSSLKLGWGNADLIKNNEIVSGDNIFVISPEAGIEVNLLTWCRLGITGGYRVVTGVDKLDYYGNKDFSSPYGAITFRFGGFGSYGKRSKIKIGKH